MGRLPCSSNDDGGMKKRLWTPDEDALLAKCVQENGEGGWRHIPRKAGLLRCGKSCRMRWVNYLRPNLKRGNITKDEEDLIVRLHKLLGNRWSIIAGRVPGRTDNDIKNYWNTRLTKKSVTNRGTTSRKEMNSASPDFQLDDELRKRDSHQQHSCNEDPVGEHAEAACLQENIISNLDNSARTVPNLTCQERVEISQVDYFTSPGVTTFNAFCEPVTRSRLLAFPSSCLESNMELELAPPPSSTVPSKNMIGEAEHYYRKGYASHDEYKQKWLCATAGDHPNITDGAAMLYQMDTIRELNRNYPSELDDDKSVDSFLGASSILRPPEHDTQHKMLNVFQSMDLMVSSPESTQFNIHEPEINEQELIISDLWSFL